MSLKQTFKEKGFLQRDIAEALGVSTATVSKWANGHEVVPPDLMRPLAKLIGIAIDMVVPEGAPRLPKDLVKDAA